MKSQKAFQDNRIEVDISGILPDLFVRAQDELGISCFILLYYPQNSRSYTIARVFNCPIEPFVGTQRVHLTSILEEIASRVKKPHVHRIKDSAFSNVLHRVSRVDTPNRAIYYPFEMAGFDYILLAPLMPDSRINSIPLNSRVFKSLLSLIHLEHSASVYAPQLALTEIFTKEVGHDIAVQIQTILSKLNLISSGRLKGELAQAKAVEAEGEVLATLRIADFLGVATDRNYQLREKRDFDIVDAVRTTVAQFSPDVEERHMQLRYEFNQNSIPFWGDKRAIELAIGQIIMNSIKYGVGNSVIMVYGRSTPRGIEIEVSNRSHISIPKDNPDKIFEFGWRSEKAMEMHVNGSGIGLFTVRKIVSAHLGECEARECSKTKTISFIITLPTYAAIQKELYQLAY